MLDLRVGGARSLGEREDDLGDQLSRGKRGRERAEEELLAESVRSAPAVRRTSSAPSASTTAGMSEAGSAWARLPPSVPRLRTCRSPISAAHSAIAASDGRFSSARVFERVPGRERAHAKLRRHRVCTPREVEPSDVDESARPDDPQLHDREERLTARERFRLRVGERVERLVERRGPDVLDRGRDHAAASSRSVAAAARTESTIDWYPVQRQKLPLSARRIVASSGSWSRERRSDAVRIIPGVQKPHWSPCCSTNARWIGCCTPSGREALDRRHVEALGLNREHRAALDRSSFDENGAGAALAGVAADVRAREPEAVSKRMDEQCSGLDLERSRLAVDDEPDRSRARHPQRAPKACRGGTRDTAAGRSWATR